MSGAYDWNQPPIEKPNEGGGYTLLPEGEYAFRVTGFERGEFPGSAKTEPCKKAIITMDVNGAEVKDDLILHSNFEWKLCQFFLAIGDRKHGEPLAMNWSAVTGKRGRLKIKHRVVTKNGETKTYNEVDKYLEPDNVRAGFAVSQPAAAPAWSGPASWGAPSDEPTFP